MAALKVFGVNLDGRYRGLIATTSKAKAAQAFGVTIGRVNNYGSVTGNTVEVAIALSTPGLPWKALHSPYGSPYLRVEYGKHWAVLTDAQP
jgi:hypothetical protein